MYGGENNFTGKYNLPQMTPVQIESINKAVSLGGKNKVQCCKKAPS